ncbi:MAG: phosphoglucosamine mutase [Desulfatitalea sp.]|nr:phosphoglucosamine mutase [Desulfatitalea sp.]NNJ99301.1 phosphoglucosamine mutase [Desulfatitalea sp.]
MGKLFGTDGIRGVANVYPMTVEIALAAGKVVGNYFQSTENGSCRGHIVMGRDTRVSGAMLTQAFAAGACAAGVDVWMLGILPTPGIARLTGASGALAGVVISASHNPFEDNGIKLFNSDGYKLSDPVEAEIEARLLGDGEAPVAVPRNIGRVNQVDDAGEQYLDAICGAMGDLSLNPCSVVIDCANGATYETAPVLFQRLGAQVTTLFGSPDGTNINDQCGSQHPETLAESVVRQNADVGLAFDGDGDRLIAVDETGQVLSGDQIMVVCANDLKQRGALKNNMVVSTVMSNLGFGLALERLGICWCSTQVGDRYVMETMLAEGAVLGGEDSGHLIFHELNTTGDGMVAAVQLLVAMKRAGRPLSELARIMTVYPQVLVNVPVKTKPDLATLPDIQAVIDRVEKALDRHGRVLVRYSGTQDMCRVMVEGPTNETTHAHCQEIVEAVRRAIG